MKVSLWAEIRRLHEIERLSKRAIAQTVGLLPQDGQQGVGDGGTTEPNCQAAAQPASSILSKLRSIN